MGIFMKKSNRIRRVLYEDMPPFTVEDGFGGIRYYNKHFADTSAIEETYLRNSMGKKISTDPYILLFNTDDPTKVYLCCPHSYDKSSYDVIEAYEFPKDKSPLKKSLSKGISLFDIKNGQDFYEELAKIYATNLKKLVYLPPEILDVDPNFSDRVLTKLQNDIFTRLDKTPPQNYDSLPRETKDKCAFVTKVITKKLEPDAAKKDFTYLLDDLRKVYKDERVK